MPSRDLTVADIKKLVGSRRKVDVMDTLTQDSSSMSLGQWSKYYETFPRRRILNIISLEFSCTKLDPMVEAPQVVCGIVNVECRILDRIHFQFVSQLACVRINGHS